MKIIIIQFSLNLLLLPLSSVAPSQTPQSLVIPQLTDMKFHASTNQQVEL
jgi:hypothetical protein